jgi:hypothetical protein
MTETTGRVLEYRQFLIGFGLGVHDPYGVGTHDLFELGLYDRCVNAPVFAVLRDEGAWNAVWQESSPSELLPAVDWDTEIVIFVALGSRNSGGFGVYLTLTEDDDTLFVAVQERMPGPASIVEDMFQGHAIAVATSTRATSIRFKILPPAPDYEPTLQQAEASQLAFEAWHNRAS